MLFSGPRLLAALAGLLLCGLGVWRLEGARSGLTITPLMVGATPATVYRSAGAPAAPAVVIAHGFAGSHQLMDAYALTLAQAGYVAVEGGERLVALVGRESGAAGFDVDREGPGTGLRGEDEAGGAGLVGEAEDRVQADGQFDIAPGMDGEPEIDGGLAGTRGDGTFQARDGVVGGVGDREIDASLTRAVELPVVVGAEAVGLRVPRRGDGWRLPVGRQVCAGLGDAEGSAGPFAAQAPEERFDPGELLGRVVGPGGDGERGDRAFAADVEADRPGHAGKALHLARDVTADEADGAAHRAGISSAK